MIYVTSGHEQGVGLEVYLKALVSNTDLNFDSYHLITSKKHLLETIKNCSLEIYLEDAAIKLPNSSFVKTTYIEDSGSLYLTTRSLETALSIITSKDILLTLPTKKDQLILDGKVRAGYTEYFRKKYNQSNLTMNFISSTDNVMLLTDHIPLSHVENTITKELILEKIKTTLSSFPKIREIKEVFFAGINPHCGEDGLMGSSDLILLETISELRSLYPDYQFHDSKAGDTLYFNHKNSSQLFVFAFHDQGLAPFKLKNGLVGINLTLGLPFKRVSVDHGTAPDIFGKNCADFSGMSYLLEEIQNW